MNASAQDALISVICVSEWFHVLICVLAVKLCGLFFSQHVAAGL